MQVTLVELSEAPDAANFLDRQVAAWRSNSDLIENEETEVPGIPEARGLRFLSGLDWVRVFALQDVIAVDISVTSRAEAMDALDLAAKILRVQLDRLDE